MKDAINATLMVTVASLLFLVSDASLAALDFDEDYYSECTLKNVKPGMDRSAIQLIHQACKHKATPKKCRALSDQTPGPGLLAPTEREKCVEACKTEGYYSRTFGDCSKG